ncbi:putativepod-specific dehydrogenase SAC25 [Cryptococcus neoformans Bt1]|nr:putativepod-specific dehydrogenase SAC25 [Cryptococcus neoformans var. grubii Bt1]
MSFWSSIWLWIRYQVNVIIHCGFPCFFWVQPTWSIDKIEDQEGKVVLITGGNSGTGYATALALYNAGATVYIACRDLTRAKEAAEDIKKGGERGVWGVTYPSKELDKAGGNKKGRVEIIQLDLTDLASVEKCAEEFLNKEKKLDLLFANAGIMATQEGQYTKQGYTLQFGTNVLGHHRLITLLLPLLLSSPPSLPSRVILTSSAGHSMAPKGGVNFKSVVRDPSDTRSGRGKYELDKWIEYGQSKWGNIALAKYLEDTYGKEGRLISVAVHPGVVATNLANHLPFVGIFYRWFPWLRHLFSRDPSTGALNQLYAATLPLPDAWSLNGEYVVPYNTVGICRPDLWDKKRVEEVWNWCDEQGKKFA